MRKIIKLIVISVFLSTSAQAADLGTAWSLLKRSKGSAKYYPRIIRELVREGLYFTSIPYIKEYLTTSRGQSSKEIDALIDQVVIEVGVKQLEVMPISFLKKSRAPIIQYVLAKKYFRLGKYVKSLEALNGTIPTKHSIKPFALLLEGSIFAIKKKYKSSVRAHEECIVASERAIGSEENENAVRQLKINRDSCIVGIARTHFANQKYEKAHSAYLDLSKSSHIWPEILFEEAWNSFYLKDYNRTLGKLVTYKAPVLKFVFNPEVEVLKALTFYELCAWDDVRKVADDFYKEYQKDHKGIWSLLKKHRKDYKYYYLLARTRATGRVRGNKLLNKMLKSITRDPSYRELYDNFLKGRDELSILKNVNSRNFKRILNTNLKDSLLLQRNLIGAYVRKSMHLNQIQISKMFENMSYLKLEMLNQRKEQIYNPDADITRGRGDIRNLQRTAKQYFWNFNGEFWADELGDYVFSLKSECSRL